MVATADVFVYMEGGGEASDLRSECRRAMAEFFSKTKLGTMHRPRVVACGSRGTALRDFCIALSEGKNAVLLVDSEDPIDPVNESITSGFKPWSHLKQRDNWDKPTGATDLDCHLMVQCMEAWIVSDWGTVTEFFGNGFKAGFKPTAKIEKIQKTSIYELLIDSTRSCKTKATYGKGAHSFKMLALLNPDSVINSSPWAARFIDELYKRKQ